MSSLSDADSWSYSSSNESDDASQSSESGDSDGSGDEEGLAHRMGHPDCILQRPEKSADELVKANEALHEEITDDEVLADMDSVLEYEDRAAGSVDLLRHHIEELAARTSRPSRSNASSADNPPSSEEELQLLVKYLRIEVECRQLTNYQ
ncbi:hypothetical protein MTO96_031624 [Rhipicephalus appendiculatus]